MKKIQEEWKLIGHVPRKESDIIWKQFKNACNDYFKRFHESKNQINQEEVDNFEKKSKLLDELKSLAQQDSNVDINTIKQTINEWRKIGRVPFNQKDIDLHFSKTIDGIFKKLNITKKEIELLKYDHKLNELSKNVDSKKIQNERFFITKKIEEVKSEINQLENNLGYFQYVDEKNPVVKEVHKNIQKHKDELELLKEKLKKIKNVL